MFLAKFVLPRFRDWDRGEQSKVLKAFLLGIGLPSIKFHALRACFATQLLAKGTPAAIVMKICGWRDLKTMEFYIRVAGVEEKRGHRLSQNPAFRGRGYGECGGAF